MGKCHSKSSYQNKRMATYNFTDLCIMENFTHIQKLQELYNKPSCSLEPGITFIYISIHFPLPIPHWIFFFFDTNPILYQLSKILKIMSIMVLLSWNIKRQTIRVKPTTDMGPLQVPESCSCFSFQKNWANSSHDPPIPFVLQGVTCVPHQWKTKAP